jgi:hypothetical protein
MHNVKSIITKHNAHISRNSQSQNTETDNCNCDNKNTCPLPKQCMTNNIIYTVTTNNTNDTKHYIGMTATTFSGGARGGGEGGQMLLPLPPQKNVLVTESD